MADFIMKAVRQARPMMVAVAGATVVCIGIIMIALPGPGLLIILAGLAILATEFIWARNLLDKMKGMIGKFRKNRKA